MYGKSLKPILLLCTTLAAVTACDTAPDQASDKPPATAFVEATGIGAGFENIVISTARSTITFKTLAREISDQKAMELLRAEVRKILPKYQSEWNSNLAGIYSTHFTPDELKSLTKQRDKSPYIKKWESSQQAIAKEMKKLSSPLLVRVVSEALENASKHRS